MQVIPNWKEYTATVEDIQNFLMDRILLRHNVITGRVECHIPEADWFRGDGGTETPPLPLPSRGEGNKY
jgi:hypothetical protein